MILSGSTWSVIILWIQFEALFGVMTRSEWLPEAFAMQLSRDVMTPSISEAL